MKKVILTVSLVVLVVFGLVALSIAKPQKVSNVALKERSSKFDAHKQDIKDVLSPAAVDAIDNMAELKAFLKKQQKVIKLLVQTQYVEKE